MELWGPEDLDGLSREQIIAFLCSERIEKAILWNAWRLKGGSVDLSDARLTGANLRGMNFYMMCFNGADLGGVDLSHADLQYCEMNKAYMSRAILAEADLQSAQMAAAHLFRADLRDAILMEARLDGANLHNAVLDGANMKGASLQKASLVRASLKGASLQETDMEGADLGQADLTDANLTQCLLEHANLTGVKLENAILHLATLRDVFLARASCLRGIRLYQTNFWGAMGLPYEYFLDDRGRSTIWEETQGRFSEAVDVYKSLKGFYEDAGDYEAGNWAYLREQSMKKLMFAPRFVRWMYPAWRVASVECSVEHCKPNFMRWLGLEIADQLAGYGLSLMRPLMWVLLLILLFSSAYAVGGMLTTMPGCAYADLSGAGRAGCAPTYNYLDALRFSLSAVTTMSVGRVQPFVSGVELLASLEALIGIALTGLFGFILGNKLRNS
jgi:uncharacterized protein YjbI with pentapeptide repeats